MHFTSSTIARSNQFRVSVSLSTLKTTQSLFMQPCNSFSHQIIQSQVLGSQRSKLGCNGAGLHESLFFLEFLEAPKMEEHFHLSLLFLFFISPDPFNFHFGCHFSTCFIFFCFVFLFSFCKWIVIHFEHKKTVTHLFLWIFPLFQEPFIFFFLFSSFPPLFCSSSSVRWITFIHGYWCTKELT